MTDADDIAIIERVNDLPQDRQRVYPGTPEFAVLIRHCRHVTYAAWRDMNARHRWAWLAHLTVPGMTDEEADRIVDEAAAECPPEAIARIDQALSIAADARRTAAVQAQKEHRARVDSKLKRAFKEYDDLRRARLRDADRWNLADAAFMLGRSESTISRWIKAGLAAEKVLTGGPRTYQQIMKPDDVRAWASNPHRRTRRRHQG